MSKECSKNDVGYDVLIQNDRLKSVVINKTFCYDNLALKKSSEGLIDSLYRPPTHTSSDFKNWIAILDLKTCAECRNSHGKIYYLEEIPESEPPLPERCRCEIKSMEAAFIGTATKDGTNGADVYVSINGNLPGYYITKKQAQKLGWISFLSNLSNVAPDKVIGGDVYYNRNGHLPDSPGRVWYEADINYESGYRNHHRLIYSNDGLIFATYDHYETFIQIH